MIIFIPENVPSLKNSKIATTKGVFMSKTCRRYLQKIGVKSYSASRKEVVGYKNRPNWFEQAMVMLRQGLTGKPPYRIDFHFVRDSKRRFDFLNAVQILADLMVAHRVIEDDDMDNFIPGALYLNDRWYSIDKQDPGVWIQVGENDN